MLVMLVFVNCWRLEVRAYVGSVGFCELLDIGG